VPQVTQSGKNGETPPKTASLALVAVGSNRSLDGMSPAQMVTKVLADIAKDIGMIRAQSKLYRTPAFPAGSGPDFVNAAFAIETDLGAKDLLESLHAAEMRFGRTRRTRWAARTLDLDLIAYENQVLPDISTFSRWADLGVEEQQQTAPPELVLPHPRMHQRAFVLVPLADVAADWVHPVLGRTVSQMVEALPKTDLQDVRAL